MLSLDRDSALLLGWYLDDWEQAAIKERGLSQWLAGLAEWGQPLQVYACRRLLKHCLQLFQSYEEPHESDKDLFDIPAQIPTAVA